MTDREIISKLAEEVYLRRVRNPGTYNPSGYLDSQTDWIDAERAVCFFEEKDDYDDFQRQDKLDEFGWLYNLYCRLKGIDSQ